MLVKDRTPDHIESSFCCILCICLIYFRVLRLRWILPSLSAVYLVHSQGEHSDRVKKRVMKEKQEIRQRPQAAAAAWVTSRVYTHTFTHAHTVISLSVGGRECVFSLQQASPSHCLLTLSLLLCSCCVCLCSLSEAAPSGSTNEQAGSDQTQISRQLRSSRNSNGIWGGKHETDL